VIDACRLEAVSEFHDEGGAQSLALPVGGYRHLRELKPVGRVKGLGEPENEPENHTFVTGHNTQCVRSVEYLAKTSPGHSLGPLLLPRWLAEGSTEDLDAARYVRL
jgi:hypothetical protein